MKKNRKRKIINRNIVMLVIVFVAVMAVLIHSYAEESNVSQEEIESSDTIHNVDYSYTSDNKKYYQTFEYQDEMLAADSGTLSTDLAKVTVGLATAAYDEREITACLSSMNYTLVASKTFNYDGVRKATYEDNDFVAFSIGYKKVSLNGETYNAYVVPIRGTTGNDEWLSNFKLGAAGDSYHYGFKKAADGVLSTLRSKIKTKNNIFLITGHSRGAAVANIVAGELTIDKDLASADHIFGYTYACPAVKIGADTTLDNVININNPGDAIPELPLADWGYQRYGKSLSLSTDKKFYDNLKVQYKNALGREYAGILNTDSYVATLKTIAGTRDAYFQPENQMLFELAGWLLGPKTKEMDTLAKILAHYNVNGLIGKSISNILSDITVSGVQTAFDKENQNNKEILITIDGYLEDTVNMNESEFEDWRTSISNTSTFEKLQDEMNIAIRTRSDLVQLRKEVKEEMDSFSYTQSNLETILSLFYTTKGELKNAIFDGHTPLTYVKWINSTYYGWRGWQNNDDVKNMEIENNIKRIDISCFQGCQNLNQVILPDTLEHVRRDAFEGCTGIKELTMPVDLDYVKTSYTNGNPSFYNCGNIEKITYSKGKTGIMPDIKSNKEGVYISYYTAEYYAGKNLTTVEFEEGVKNIGARAYYSYRTSINSGMPNLKNIKLASTVKKIGDYAFCNNKAITDFDFSNIEELGERSFSGCSGLSDLTIPAGLKEMPYFCFYGCTGLSSLKIPETIEKVCGGAFGDCTGIKELTMPVDLDYVKNNSSTNGYSSFFNCGNIEKITYSKGKTGIMPDIESGSTSYDTAECYAGKSLTTVEFEEGVKNIGARAYYFYRNSITSGCVYGMPNLKNIKLASTVKKIGDYAFYKNIEITKFDFSNIEELGESSFSGCRGLSDLTIPAGLKEIPASCFYECTGLSSLKIPETIEKVCGGAFGDCTGIKELTMPVDLDYVKNGYSSFSNCGNIEKITYSKGKTGIMPDIDKGSTWYYTAEYYAGNNLTTVEFEEGVKNIGARAYCWHADAGGSGLKNIKLASTVKKIGDDAFYENTEITKFDFSNIEELGESSFYGCSGLTDLKIPAGMKEIPASCFYGCTGLSSLKIPETIEKVCGYAFGDCTGIKELTMPVDLDYVNKSRPSFRDCGNIEKITYSKGKTGIMPDTDNADIDNGSTWYYTAEYYAGNNLTTVEFEEGVKNIGARAYCWHAGAGGSGLKNIKLASTVKKIGDDAFYKNTEITKFDFSNIEELGERSFYGCSGLSDLTIPAGMKEIPASCFYGCTSLSSLKISETIEKVCGDAFEDCTGIKELTMPVDLDYVKAYSSTDGYPSFRNCGNIEKITYSKGKTGTMPDIKSGSASYYTAEYYAGKKLTTVEFQSGIEYIGAGSFDQASALKNIVLPCTVSAISSKTFCAINKSEAVIYGTKDTYAEAYAKEQKIPFRGWNDPIITSEEPVAAPEEQVQLVGIAYTGVDEYVNISDWSVKECESKDTHIDENGLLTVGKDEPKGEIVVAACYGNYTETVKVRIVNPTYTVHFVGDITLDAKTDENCNVYCPKEYEEKGYEYQYYLGKDTDSEQIEEKDWPLTVAQDTEIYVKKILKEPSIDKINPTEKEMDFIYDGEKREISISASHEIGEKGVLSYQWYYDEMQDGDFEEIHLATGASISVKDVKDSGVYKCRVTLCDGKDTTWVDSKVVCVNITQRLVPIPILQDSQKNLYYTGVEQKLLFEKLETDWVNITEAAATLPGNYVASVGLKDAENSIWADSTKEAKEYPWKIIGKETTPKPLESPTVTNAPTYEPGNTARPSGAPDENPSKTPEIKPGEVPTESPAATDTPTYEPGNTARPSGAPDENPERTPEIKASEVPTDVPEIKPTIAPDKITTGSQDTDLVFQPEDMTGDSREEALFLEKKVNVKKLQNKKKNKLYISWGKVELPQKAFYQVQISTKRNFKGAKNIYTTKSIYCYKGVKKGKKYYVRVRLGVTRDGKKIYGKWSNLKKKKIKN